VDRSFALLVSEFIEKMPCCPVLYGT